MTSPIARRVRLVTVVGGVGIVLLAGTAAAVAQDISINFGQGGSGLTERVIQLIAFLTVLSLFIFGGPVLRGFSFALVIGILIGTYSSIAVAAPMLVAWQEWRSKRGKAVVLPAAKRSRV